MAAITEQTRNASKASRGLNTIMARLASVLDESSSNGKAIKQIYADLGIAMEDTNGQLLSGYDLLELLAKEWNNLDGNTQKYIATTVAGTTQLNNFLALMNNFEHATDATKTAIESQGSALKENERYMESLNAKVAALKNTFQDFANNVIDNELVGAILDLSNGFLQLANTDLGQMVTQISLLTALGWGSTSLLQASHIIPAVVSQFTTFFSVATKGAEATAAAMTAAGTATTAFGAVVGSVLPVILGIAAVAVIGKKIYDNWKDANSALEEANSKLQTNRDRLAEINNLSWNELTPDILREKNALEEENNELQRQIDLLEKRKIKAAEKEARSGGIVGTGSTRYSALYGEDYITTLGGKGFDTYEELVEYLDRYIPEAAKKTREELEALGVQFFEVEEKVSVTAEEYNQHLITLMQDYITQLNKQHALNTDQIQDFSNLSKSVSNRVDGLKALKDANQEITEQEQNLIDVYDQLLSAYDSAVEVTNLQTHSVEVTSDAVDKLTKKYPALKAAISDVNGTLYLDVNALDAVKTETWDAKKAMLDLIAQMTVFNNADLDVSQKLSALQKLAAGAGVTSTILSSFTTGGINENYARFRNAGLSEDEAMNKLWESWFRGYSQTSSGTAKSVSMGSTGSTGTSNSTSKGKTALEKANEAWKEQLNLLKDRLEILQKSGGAEEQQIAKIREIQDAIHKQAEAYRSMGLSEEHEYLRELGILWWDYENDIKSVYDEIEKASEEAAEKARQAWEDSLNEQKSNYEIAASVVVDKIQEELNNLQALRDETAQYYDDKIQALKDSNDELDKQIEYEELLNRLAQAKQKKLYVFKDGQFQYIDDVASISAAQADLDAYERERALEQEVANLERLKNDALASIDEQIDGWEKYKDEWSNVVQQYTDKQNRLIAEQVLGINLEQKNWEKRLMNAQSFADKYNSIMANLSVASADGAVAAVGGSSSMSSSDLNALAQAGRDYNNAKTQAEKDAAHAKAEAIRNKYGYSGGTDGSEYIPTSSGSSKSSNSSSGNSNSSASASSGRVSQDIGGRATHPERYASGTLSALGGLSVVGEQGPELRVLGRGDGVLPSDITRNLWEWGKINPASMMSAASTIFNIDNLSLPNVKDTQSFVTGLKQLAYQRAYKRA